MGLVGAFLAVLHHKVGACTLPRRTLTLFPFWSAPHPTHMLQGPAAGNPRAGLPVFCAVGPRWQASWKLVFSCIKKKRWRITRKNGTLSGRVGRRGLMDATFSSVRLALVCDRTREKYMPRKGDLAIFLCTVQVVYDALRPPSCPQACGKELLISCWQ